MEPYLRNEYGNASSAHQAGQAARKAVEEARANVASLIGARYASEVIFTSGGTESIWTALNTGIQVLPTRRYIASTVEHTAVLDAIRASARAATRHYSSPSRSSARSISMRSTVRSKTARRP